MENNKLPIAKDFFIENMLKFYKSKYTKEEVEEIFTSQIGDENAVADGMLSSMNEYAKLHLKELAKILAYEYEKPSIINRTEDYIATLK